MLSAVWGSGGTSGGGSAIIVSTAEVDQAGAVSADGSAPSSQLYVGQGGAEGGGPAEVG